MERARWSGQLCRTSRKQYVRAPTGVWPPMSAWHHTLSWGAHVKGRRDKWRDATFNYLGFHEVMRHGFNSRTQFGVLHRSREILQDHPAWRVGEALLESFDILAAAAADVHQEHAVPIVFCALVAIEKLFLHGKPVGIVETIFAACRHEGVEISEGLGVSLNIFIEGEVGVKSVLEGCGARVGGALVAILLEISGHLGEELESVVKTGGGFSCQPKWEMTELYSWDLELKKYWHASYCGFDGRHCHGSSQGSCDIALRARFSDIFASG